MWQSRSWASVYLVVGLLVVSNVVVNRLLPDALYVPWNLGMATLLVLTARRLDGRSWSDLGLGRESLGRGLRLGGLVVGLTVLVYLVAAVLPGTRDLFDDARVEDMGLGEVLYNALIRVPLGTVALEEIAFRGVLPAMLVPRLGLRPGVLASAGLFGLWHILPSTNLSDRNPVAEDILGDVGVLVPITLAVVATAAAGLVLWLLRRWSGSLAAPALAHWSTNGLGYLLAHALG